MTRPALKERQDLIGHLTPDGKKMFERFQNREGRADHADVMAKYEHGLDVELAINDPDKYGPEFLADLSELIGVSESQLQLYRQFSRTYAKEQVTKLLEREIPGRGRITFSHFRAAMSEEDPTKRKELLNRVFKESLSAQELESEVSARKPGKRGAADTGRPPSKPKSIQAGLRQISSTARTFARKFPVWDEAVFDAIKVASPDALDDEMVDKLDESVSELEQLLDGLDGVKAKAQKALERVQQITQRRREDHPAATNGHHKGPIVHVPTTGKRPGAKKVSKRVVARATSERAKKKPAPAAKKKPAHAHA